MTITTEVERMRRSRVIPAPAAEIFAVLNDPARHRDTEPTDWVRDAVDRDRLTAVGQVFGMTMFHVNAGGTYVMHNEVIALEPDRVIAWRPGQHDDDGGLHFGGWIWRYDLAPAGPDATAVTLTYDWSATPSYLREEITFPPFPPDFLDRSLLALETATTTG